MSTLPDCIVTLIDMIGVRKLLDSDGASAVAVMRKMHSVIPKAAKYFTSDTEICVWNDSVLIHTPVNASEQSYEAAMRPIPRLKAGIDEVCRSYAICVKGQSFMDERGISKQCSARLVFLSASSLAFKNCETVHEQLKGYRRDWYVDNRIIQKIRHSLSRDADCKAKVSLLYPTRSARTFHMFRGSFTRSELS